jgi:hypothetical protein
MRLLGIVLVLGLIFQLSPALADGQTYHDKSITFTAPDDWSNLNVPPPASTEDSTLVAMFVKDPGHQNARAIQIVVKDFDGSLDAFDSAYEKELKTKSDSTFITSKKVTLSNGMPAYWLKVSQGSDVGQYTRRFEYVIIDLKRGITVSYIGRQGDFEEKDAQAALAGLSVVAYPRDR